MYDRLTPELKTEKAWVNVWDNSKVPMQSSIRKAASSVLPETWSDFDTAAAAVESGVYDGLGYVFHDTGLIGIDIDTGYDGKFLSHVAADIIGRCRSYTEKSRSGRGFHILVKGTIPFKGKNNRAGVEMYQSSRYFIMTGNVLVFPEIVENQAALDYVVETYFPETQKEGGSISAPQRIYTPIYQKPVGGRVRLSPDYPPILPGCRNLSLTSLAGQLHSQGYAKGEIYKELLRCNSIACQPPLDRSEVELIVNSVTRYRR